MKKITKIAATFAVAMAMLLVAASCSHDGGASLAALSNTGAGGGGGGGGAGGGGGTAGTPINFDCTDATTEIGAAVASVHTAAEVAEQSMTAGTFDSVTITGDMTHPKTTMYIIQLKKNNAKAEFDVKSGAKISISACSSGSGKSTYYTVSGAAEGNDTVENATASDVKTLQLTATSDGKVTIAAPSKMSDNSTDNNNLRIQKITVTY